ncbi:WD40 repeat-like protein [Lophiostoma macrostomum CBS 122681]|uniref:WD40 repeat-like protein n=1 Tax=Lophiostoma macrostomum CBS 122681 TaxID=1314788 RepID=A0A6A6TQ03_9PLEO|nr:WD40 repeat-like protein [Lophiostoma macrostomum CBS 122681]
MAPPQRARSLPRSAFTSSFPKLKTLTYTDNLRPSAPVPSAHFIRTLSWNAPGTFIATGASDKTLRIWNPEKPNVKHSTELKGLVAPVDCVQFHPFNENELASATHKDGLVKFWDVRTKASIGEIKVAGEPFQLAWTPDGTQIVVGTKDNNLIQVDRSTLKPISEHKQDTMINQSVFAWSGNHLFVTHDKGTVSILRYPSFELAHTLNAHAAMCMCISMSPSGEHLAVGAKDGLASIWDTQEWISLRTLSMDSVVRSVDFSFDGSYVVAGSDEDKKLQIAHVETGEIVHTIDNPHPASQVAWHPCRYVLAYSAASQGLKIIGGVGFVYCFGNFVFLLGTQHGHYSILNPYANIMDVQAPINPASLFSAKGLSVVITGGGSGLGLAIAAALYQNDATKIYLLGRRSAVLTDTIRTLEASPSAPQKSSILAAIPCDVTDSASISAAVDRITKETGYVDVLINNAGVIGPENREGIYGATSITALRDALLYDMPGWDTTLAINTKAVIGVSAAFLPLLEAANARRGWASGRVTGSHNPRTQDTSVLAHLGLDADDDRLAQIITVASVASVMRWCSAGLAYNASKAGALHLGKMMASFLAEWGIRSNVLCPGPYPSEMTARYEGRYGTNQVPQGRKGGINDVAGTMLFLVGKGGAYVDGQVMVSDGGRVSVFPSTY